MVPTVQSGDRNRLPKCSDYVARLQLLKGSSPIMPELGYDISGSIDGIDGPSGLAALSTSTPSIPVDKRSVAPPM